MWYWLLGAWTKLITDSSQQLNRRVFGCHSNQWKALFVQKKKKKNIPPKTWLFSREGWIPDRNCLSESDKRMERQSPHVLCEPLTLQALSEGLLSVFLASHCTLMEGGGTEADVPLNSMTRKTTFLTKKSPRQKHISSFQLSIIFNMLFSQLLFSTL